jgi:folate-binding protein YgfZ
MMVVRDLSAHGRLRLTGPDRARFLHGMVTNDVTALAPGQGCHAAMLTVKGKLLGDLRIYCGDDWILVETDPEAAGKIAEALAKHLIMDEVEIEDVAPRMGELGVWGEGAREALGRALGGEVPELPPHGHVEVGGARVAGSRALGMNGYRVFGQAAEIIQRIGVTPIADEAAEVLRVEAGEPRYGVDMGEDHLPIESRLDAAISFSKGCYLGQEVIVRATQQGRINRKLMGLRLAGERPAARGAKLSAPGREEAGLVTSSVVSPRHGAIALAYVHRTVWAPGTKLTLREEGGERAAVVSELPF